MRLERSGTYLEKCLPAILKNVCFILNQRRNIFKGSLTPAGGKIGFAQRNEDYCLELGEVVKDYNNNLDG